MKMPWIVDNVGINGTWPWIVRLPERTDKTGVVLGPLRSVSEVEGSKRTTMELLERLAANDPQLTALNYVPSSVGMHELATALALNTTLTILNLSGRGLVDADAHELARACGIFLWRIGRNYQSRL